MISFREIGILILLLVVGSLGAQTVFTDVQQVLDFADEYSLAAQADHLKAEQARRTQLAARVAIFDPTLNNTLGFTNNTRLPVNLFPAEAFGGQAGEYREVQTGVQYNTFISSNLDIKLLNFSGIEDLKLAKLNLEIVENDAQLARKTRHQNVAATYFNIVQLQAQREATQRNLAAADTLLAIAERQYREGLAKPQDVNDSRVNRLNTGETLRQIELMIHDQHQNLLLLLDLPEDAKVEIVAQPITAVASVTPDVQVSDLLLRSQTLRLQSAGSQLKKADRLFWPNLSLVAGNQYNQYNPDFTLFGGRWIHSQSVGLRLNVNLPNVSTITNRTKAKYDYLISSKNAEQTQLKAGHERTLLANEWQKATSQVKTNADILALQHDTYAKNQHLYREGLLAMDRILTSFSAMVNAEYQYIASQVSLQLALTRIEINNKF
jgi:outer membrane protein TolC